MKSYQYHSFLSPAKLNLGLRIVGKRADGYHLLKSVFCFINILDKVDIQITENGKISLIEHNQAWFYQTDLSYKAAKLLQETTGCKLGANIRLRKVIPSGAGMGGGSSNAATVLIVLNQLWQTGLSQEELSKLGLKLGADIPFFIKGVNALVEGVGEIITAIEIPQMYFVIVKPSFHVPTRDIFANVNYEKNFSSNDANLITIDELLTKKENDLEKIAKKIYPALDTLFMKLNQYGKPVMTGSGSCVYLSFFDKDEAKKVAKVLKVRYNTFLAERLTGSPVSLS